MEAATKLTAHKQAFAVVWTRLPLLTLFCPCVGHAGIATSQGETHDFGGSQWISIDRLSFGDTVKYVPLQLTRSDAETFDNAIHVADDLFRMRDHSLLGNNCHHHVAAALTTAKYRGKMWTACAVWWLTLRRGKFLTRWECLKTYGLCGVLVVLLGLLALLGLY